MEVSIPFPESARILSPTSTFKISPRNVIIHSARTPKPVFSLQNPASPMDLESIFNAKGDRADTLKIFTQKIDAVREMEDLQKRSESKTTEKMNTQQMVIKRGDSIKTIKAVVENGKKQFGKKTKEKLKGSMYVNELWGNSYENEVMRATNIDKVIHRQEEKSRKPFFEKLRDMADSFEKRTKEKETLPAIWPKNASASIDPMDMGSFADYLKSESSNEGSQTPGGSDSGKKIIKAKLSMFSKPTRSKFVPRSPVEVSEDNILRARVKSCPDAHDIINAALGNQTPNANGDYETHVMHTETSPAFRGNNLTLASKLVVETSRRVSISSTARPNSGVVVKSPEAVTRKSKFNLNLDFAASTPSNPRITPLSGGGETPSGSLKSPGKVNSISFRSSIQKEPLQQNFIDKNNEKLEALIGQCQSQLDDKKNYKEIIHELKGLFVKKRGYLKEQMVKQKKETGVDQCRFFLNKTQRLSFKKKD